MAAADDRVDIIDRILTNKIKKSEVKAALADLEKKYGNYAYADDSFCPKEKPWNKNYYSELEKISITGVSSKKFILHLVEVRDHLKAKKIAAVMGSVIICAVIAVIIMAILC